MRNQPKEIWMIVALLIAIAAICGWLALLTGGYAFYGLIGFFTLMSVAGIFASDSSGRVFSSIYLWFLAFMTLGISGNHSGRPVLLFGLILFVAEIVAARYLWWARRMRSPRLLVSINTRGCVQNDSCLSMPPAQRQGFS
jgi:hypothetical protein